MKIGLVLVLQKLTKNETLILKLNINKAAQSYDSFKYSEEEC